MTPFGLNLTGALPTPTVSNLLSGVSRGAQELANRAGALAGQGARAAGLTQRGVRSRPGRHHIEVRGVAQPGSERLAHRVEEALERIPGVRWARVNAPTGRVVVAVDDPAPRLRDLIAAIVATERTDDCEHHPDDRQPHPPEEGPRTRRAVSTLAADAFGLGLTVATRILPFTPLPGEFAGLLKAIDMHPKLHALVGQSLRGDHRADSFLPLAEALALGLTGGWAGILLDGAQRVLQWQEARAQLTAWQEAEPRLAGTPELASAGPLLDGRPRPKPDGPLERYVARMLTAGALAGATALPFAGPKRAAALAMSGLSNAPFDGRESYAAQLGRALAARGVIAMDRSVLRELDRVDTLVLDESVLHSNRGTLTDLVPLAGDPEEVAAQAFALFDPTAPDELRQADGWRLGPFAELGLAAPNDHPEASRLFDSGGTVLGLAHGGELAAAVKYEPEPAPGVDALPSATRRVGVRLVVASADADRYDFADAVVPGGPDLTASIRSLQAEGAMVMLVSGDRRALGAADCGLGIWHPAEAPPWGAHLLVGADLEVPAFIVEAVGVAKMLTRQNIALAAAGTSLGALTAFTSPVNLLPRRTMNSVNLAGAMALANGIWRAKRLPTHGTARPTGVATPWHLMPVPTVLARLDTGTDGLSSQEAQRRGRDTGADDHQGMSLGRAFVDELANPLTPVLVAGAGLSAAVGSVVDAALVGGVVGLSALVGAIHQINTEKSLSELLSRSAVTARVRRDGAERVVAANDLVTGDIVLVGPGDAIPADCRVLEAAGLEADESSLTGESLPVTKDTRSVVAAAVADRHSMLYEGTTVAAGRGVAVVVATGSDTEVGRGMALARQAPPGSGVEARLTKLTKATIPVAAGAAMAVAGAGLFRGVPLAETAATAANLAVASVPEGLPFLVSAAQLAAARRLADHGALVRNPRTIEALGRVDVLCFDKTGTLTEGHLRLAGVADSERYAEVDALDRTLRHVLAAALRATPEADQPEQLSGQTDRAVLVGAQTAEVQPTTGCRSWQYAAALPFEPSRGYHATVGNRHQTYLLSVKGAPETILPRCGRKRTRNGDEALDDAGREALQEMMGRHAGAGQRVLAVAERVLDHDSVTDADVTDLTFVGCLTLADGVRASAAPAVARIRQAGVHTIMITGDHPGTAAAIASIISTDDTEQRVATGTELDRLDDAALAERLARTDVVARCTPAHKVRIIQALQQAGRVVAMTGDGANDAPAIRLADVGIALGQRGTPAARAAADLVVTDDRLETIIATLVEGRAMWSSVRHALSILVGGNLGEIAFSVLTAAATGRSALNGRQLLLVNLLTDLAPAMAIAIRAPNPDATDGLLLEGPDSSLGGSLNREIASRAATTTLGATAGWTLARYTGRQRRAGTIALASLVGTQLGQTVVDGGASPAVLVSTAGSLAVLAGVIQTPGVSQFFGCTPLGPLGWGIAAGSALGATFASSTLSRFFVRPDDDHAPADGSPADHAPAEGGADAGTAGAGPDGGTSPGGSHRGT
ncbi:HAD-IC family P-type ATPase [Micromonospora sp. NBC_01796]|uniref:HAD-IC family P-type ATPase n=1 Tax=Micromonospora sp. NBC_01796 TaxID=2975987 RepID=UPI002DD8CFB8|nr:HAD-IC family P-type ATPase [Micromonospora sp. NBC_01796]WSA88583.1 cation-translocating P-type ATPase [Micromonospora sp. NBC_01796]